MGNANAILVPQMARLWLAPIGTTAPADPVTAFPAGWLDVGYFDPASLQWQTAPTFQTVSSHQSIYPTRRFQDADAATISCSLQEWSANNILTVYGGGTITTMTGSPPAPATWYQYNPPLVGGRTQTAACIEIIDGTKHYRRVIPICEQDSGNTVTYHRTSESTLPLALTVIGSDLGSAWYDLTDDPAMAPAPPTITGVSPATGAAAGGTVVTITGTGFTAGATVTFGVAAATGVIVASSTYLICTTPAHAAGAVNVVVTTPEGTATDTGAFTYS